MSRVFPTVRQVLALDPVRRGAPRLVAGEVGLDRPVRWVHVAEVPDIATLLGGGELVLTTGIGLPADDAGLRAFIADLAGVGVSGLVVELGRRYHTGVPKVMAAAAGRHGLPLVELRRATPFVRITEAVHALIVDAQLTELRATEEIHQRFTELSVEGAEPDEVIRQAAELSGCPVVLENLSRQVLAYDPARENAELLLDGWEQHSRRIRPAGRTAYDPDSGWLVTMVGARGEDWGRLLLRWPGGVDLSPGGADSRGPGDDESGKADDAVSGLAVPPTRLTILVERAASTLALGRLIRRDAEGWERQIHRTLLTALLDRTRPVDEVALRARALGLTLDRRHLVGVVVRHRGEDPADNGPAADPGGDPGLAGAEPGAARLRDLAETVGQALREAKLTGLTSAVDDQAVGVLLALADAAGEERALTAFAAALRRTRPDSRPPDPASRRPGNLIIAAGSGVSSLREAGRSSSRPGRSPRRPGGTGGTCRSSGCRTSGSPGCCTCCATSRACRRSSSASWEPCWRTTPGIRASNCSAPCARTWSRAGTSRRRPRRRTCPDLPSTNGWPASVGSSTSTWTRSTPASPCTSPCSPWTPSAPPDSLPARRSPPLMR